LKDQNTKKSNIVWIAVLVLFACVCLTMFTFTKILKPYMPDSSGAISLIPETDGSGGKDDGATDNEGTDDGSAQGGAQGNTIRPDFEVSDDNGEWQTQTEIELFNISYQNGEQNITVESNNGEQIIAPGTNCTYVFKLKNTGNVNLDYTVDLDAFFTPGQVKIPVNSRLLRYDGRWIVGDDDSFETVTELDSAHDSTTIGHGRYVYYTLEWEWPFESGDDLLDTELGNMATKQDITFTVKIATTAQISPTTSGGIGILLPNTGDNSGLDMWLALAGGSLVVIMFLIIYIIIEKKREKDAQTN